MNTYLETLRNMERDQSRSKVYEQASKYRRYEDFLHRKQSQIRQKRNNRPIYEPRIQVNKQVRGEAVPTIQNQSQTVFYPVQRKQIEYQDHEYIERVPKKRVVVDYIQKKQVQIVPKQVITTDYYAVEHLRHYIKNIVPQVRIQTVKVPKIIKHVEYQPVQKQTIFYPNYMKDINQIKAQSKIHLQKLGVVIRQDAQYQPIALKNSNMDSTVAYSLPKTSNLVSNVQNQTNDNIKATEETNINTLPVNSNLPIKNSPLQINRNMLGGIGIPTRNGQPMQPQSGINESYKSLQRMQAEQTRLGTRLSSTPYVSVSRSVNQVRQQKRNQSEQPYQQLGLSGIPIYTKQKYQLQLNSSNKRDKDYLESADYSFAERDHYRYNLTANSSLRKRY